MAVASGAASAAPLPQAEAHARSLAATCANCHGSAGVSAGGTASLAGTPADALTKTMQEYRGGTRAGTVMPQLAKGYTDDDLAALAGWFARQPKP